MKLFLVQYLLVLPTTVLGFQKPLHLYRKSNINQQSVTLFASSLPEKKIDELLPYDNVDLSTRSSRRAFFVTTASFAAALGAIPQNAAAGIDVSGLRVEGGVAGNPSIASQLKSYDGSGSARVKEIKSLQETPTASNVGGSKPLPVASKQAEDPRAPMATWAYRANPGIGPSLTKTGLIGNLYRYNDQVVAPQGSKRRALNIQFEFPSDWLQLDRALGGIQYVDQRNGDKLYVFRAPLPDDKTLATVSKSVIGDLIFNPNGSLIKTGQTVEDYKVVSGQTLSECPDNLCATHRRFKIKYTTVTGNNLSVERRGLVDAYQVENDIYMLMTSSNAVKFDKKDSLERETAENIVASFQVDA